MTRRGALLVDFGSTFTKVRAVDLERSELVASAQAPSTVETGLMGGLTAALAAAKQQAGVTEFDGWERRASSSAAGGLRIVAVGLVESLTAEAARRAALCAGGKIIATFANGLTAWDVGRIVELDPDLIVLAGGTDGGDRTSLVANADSLARAGLDAPIVVAGNRNVADDAARILEDGGCSVVVVDNVMPNIGTLHVAPCQEAIRQAFMERIVKAKGLGEVEEFFGRIIMPTPQAVLEGCRVLCDGPGSRRGLGELVCVDVGGATTDVYSLAAGAPSAENVAVHGLSEPFVKRTVEGDLGVRVNAPSVVSEMGEDVLAAATGIESSALAERAFRLADHTEAIAETPEEAALDMALAGAAVELASHRHAGMIEQVFTPDGTYFVQRGKDLRLVPLLIGTGGVFASQDAGSVRAALVRGTGEGSGRPALVPSAPDIFVDTDYVLFAVGLLADVDADAAFTVATKSLTLLESAVRAPA